MEFPTIEKRKVTEEIADKIIEFILHGELKPLDKLPAEREMAAMLGVSRPSLREALQTLATRNIVEIRHGAGVYVTSLEPKLLLEPLDFFLALNEANFEHLFEARKVLEGELAALAAQRITKDELAHLQECVRRTEQSLDDAKAYAQADLDLHNSIMAAARNPMLERMMMGVSDLTWASRQHTVNLPGVRLHSPKDHRAIVDALSERNPEKSRQMMLKHLGNIKQALDTGELELDGDEAG
ncbi:MAG: hypothetical protein B6I34_02480 [Anaerolineaceae bacterium 4572_32.1]|nr:MAG: hypothetical protein B6I34_02480 [Anaerolineaceae bacterium 4572_32.1]HEY73422.1 FadR family transcriptional regulator [Thermoflexia bacterium]